MPESWHDKVSGFRVSWILGSQFIPFSTSRIRDLALSSSYPGSYLLTRSQPDGNVNRPSIANPGDHDLVVWFFGFNHRQEVVGGAHLDIVNRYDQIGGLPVDRCFLIDKGTAAALLAHNTESSQSGQFRRTTLCQLGDTQALFGFKVMCDTEVA